MPALQKIAAAGQRTEQLRLKILQRVYELMTAAMSLVAALAWNDAIQTTFKIFFGDLGSLYAKYGYALFVTVLIVWFGQRLTHVTRILGVDVEEKKVS